MFADDSNLFYSHHNLEMLFTTVNKELLIINSWFKCNKLSINASKTKYFLFHKSRAAIKLPSLLPDLLFNNTKINRYNTIKFLGVTIDEHLTWRMQINNIEKKISKGIGLLFRARPYLTKNCLIQLYYAYVNSHQTWNFCYIPTRKIYRKTSP
jgi:hypothetical protein